MLYITFFLLITLTHSLNLPINTFRQWHCIGFSKNINFQKPYKFNIGTLPLIAYKHNNNFIMSNIDMYKYLGSKLDNTDFIHNSTNVCGNIIEYQDKIWWSYKPFNKKPTSIPYYRDKTYVKQNIQIDINASISDCALNSMDLQSLNGLFEDESQYYNIKPLLFKDRIGIHFTNPIKKPFKNTKLYILEKLKYYKIFNMFITPSTYWNKLNIRGTSKNIIIFINMLPLEPEKTRFFVTIKHNFNNKQFIEILLTETISKLISYKKNNNTTYDKNIEYVDYLRTNYIYPDIYSSIKLIKMIDY